eukprot:Seg944.6 transcript_id=Seg944.6/GoldUCD/mRNA.D3Y31 product="hypothetical protein" protein_id=Seg944.6/GoldUCD/D3Y31
MTDLQQLGQFLKKFNSNCSRYLEPCEYLQLDETLYPMPHQNAFHQYNPDKTAKYSMLFKSINDARCPYTYILSIYAGKPEAGDGPYFISGTEPIVRYLVERIEKVQPIGVPDELKTAKEMKEHETRVFWEQSDRKMSISSYLISNLSIH